MPDHCGQNYVEWRLNEFVLVFKHQKRINNRFYRGRNGWKIPRQIKEKVIRQWLQGTRRSTIAKDNGIGGPLLRKFTGRVLWHGTLQATSTFIKWKGLEPVVVFSIRLLKKMEDDGVNLSQVEPIDPTLPPTASNTRYPLPRLFKVDTKHFR